MNCPICNKQLLKIQNKFNKSIEYMDCVNDDFSQCYFLNYENEILVFESFAIYIDDYAFYFYNNDFDDKSKTRLQIFKNSLNKETIDINRISFIEDRYLDINKIIKKVKKLMLIS